MIPHVAASPNRQKLEALFEDLWAELYAIETSVMLHLALFRDREAAAALRATAPATFQVIGAALTDAMIAEAWARLQRGRVDERGCLAPPSRGPAVDPTTGAVS